MTGITSTPRVFIDTNIWIYAFSDMQDKIKTFQARVLIRHEQNIALSTQVINEITHNLRRKFKTSEDTVRQLIRTMYRKHHVIEYTETIFLGASHLRTVYNLSFWDSTIIASAVASGAIHLYSENLHDGLIVNKQLTVINPLKQTS